MGLEEKIQLSTGYRRTNCFNGKLREFLTGGQGDTVLQSILIHFPEDKEDLWALGLTMEAKNF